MKRPAIKNDCFKKPYFLKVDAVFILGLLRVYWKIMQGLVFELVLIFGEIWFSQNNLHYIILIFVFEKIFCGNMICTVNIIVSATSKFAVDLF